jgi:signal transduction histidine kinase
VGEAARVSVKDEGPGLSHEDQAKVFKTFQSLSGKPTGGEKSTGLGLAIIKKLVEAHGGTVNAESPPVQGAVFSFFLPMAAIKPK